MSTLLPIHSHYFRLLLIPFHTFPQETLLHLYSLEWLLLKKVYLACAWLIDAKIKHFSEYVRIPRFILIRIRIHATLNIIKIDLIHQNCGVSKTMCKQNKSKYVFLKTNAIFPQI